MFLSSKDVSGVIQVDAMTESLLLSASVDLYSTDHFCFLFYRILGLKCLFLAYIQPFTFVYKISHKI